MKQVLVIIGPTATGKTDLAINLAKKYNGELIVCDSRQVYKGLDIGTGKLPSEESKSKIQKFKGYWVVDGVKIWMYDIVSLKNQYTIKNYIEDVSKVLEEVTKNNKLPIIVGGTGYYLEGLLKGIPNLDVKIDKKLRKRLEKQSLEDLVGELTFLSPTVWENLNSSDKKNPRRLIRLIEIHMNPYIKTDHDSIIAVPNYDLLKIGLSAPRSILYEKINSRVFSWISQGIFDEVKSLIKNGVVKKRFKDLGLEYSLIVEYLSNKITHDLLIEKMQKVVRNYAKRQITWFKKDKEINWFDVTEKNYSQKVEKLIRDWYNTTNEKKSRHLS